jgi:hypothetical protein
MARKAAGRKGKYRVVLCPQVAEAEQGDETVLVQVLDRPPENADDL